MASSLEVKLRGVWHEHLEKLKQAEEEFAPADPDLHYSVPRIVAIGEESSGKSSTLERLAMLEFFPSDKTDLHPHAYRAATQTPFSG